MNLIINSSGNGSVPFGAQFHYFTELTIVYRGLEPLEPQCNMFMKISVEDNEFEMYCYFAPASIRWKKTTLCKDGSYDMPFIVESQVKLCESRYICHPESLSFKYLYFCRAFLRHNNMSVLQINVKLNISTCIARLQQQKTQMTCLRYLRKYSNVEILVCVTVQQDSSPLWIYKCVSMYIYTYSYVSNVRAIYHL